MRMYFYLGINIPTKDYEKIIFAMRVMVTGYGFDKEKFENAANIIRKRKGFYSDRRSCVMAFDCKNSRGKILYEPAYEQKLLGKRKAFLWYSDNEGEWRSISPEDKGNFIVKGQHTYINFS